MGKQFYAMRGALISVIVAGHAYLFDVYAPIQAAIIGFFLLSGTYFKPKPIRKTLGSLLLPAYGISIISFFLIPAITDSSLSIQEYAFRAFMVPIWPIGNFMWFIWALTIYHILASKLYAIRAPLFAFSIILMMAGTHNLENLVGTAILYFPFFMAGIMLSNRIKKIELALPHEVPQLLVNLGQNSKWIYLTHVPYVAALSLWVRSFGGWWASLGITVVWLLASNYVTTIYKEVLK